MNLSKSEFLEKYGEVYVKFSSYFKHTFYFEGQKQEQYLDISVGGEADDIFWLNVSVNANYKVKNLPIEKATITENNQVVASYTNQ